MKRETILLIMDGSIMLKDGRELSVKKSKEERQGWINMPGGSYKIISQEFIGSCKCSGGSGASEEEIPSGPGMGIPEEHQGLRIKADRVVVGYITSVNKDGSPGEINFFKPGEKEINEEPGGAGGDIPVSEYIEKKEETIEELLRKDLRGWVVEEDVFRFFNELLNCPKINRLVINTDDMEADIKRKEFINKIASPGAVIDLIMLLRIGAKSLQRAQWETHQKQYKSPFDYLKEEEEKEKPQEFMDNAEKYGWRIAAEISNKKEEKKEPRSCLNCKNCHAECD